MLHVYVFVPDKSNDCVYWNWSAL